MANTKEPSTKGANGLAVLKGTNQALCLQLRIGNLGLKVWSFPNEEAKPYVRLIFDRDIYDVYGDNCQQERERAVTLGWQEALAVSGAIQSWMSFLESDIEECREPALHLEIESVTFDFYRQSGNQSPKMICCLENAGGLSRQVILTRSEASLLAQLLSCQGDGEAER